MELDLHEATISLAKVFSSQQFLPHLCGFLCVLAVPENFGAVVNGSQVVFRFQILFDFRRFLDFLGVT
jgi:hypothetical protein